MNELLERIRAMLGRRRKRVGDEAASQSDASRFHEEVTRVVAMARNEIRRSQLADSYRAQDEAVDRFRRRGIV